MTLRTAISLRTSLILLAAFLCVTLAVSSQPASAQLKACNGSSSKIGVALGYKDDKGWTSEGWWNIGSQSCEILFAEKLRAQYYYVYAVDYEKGGEWGGQFMMCTNVPEFTIHSIEGCEERGFKKSGFFEVDTQDQTTWTIKLTDPGDPSGGTPPGPSAASPPAATTQSGRQSGPQSTSAARRQ